MSVYSVIGISPMDYGSDEPAMINSLFEAGLYRYHINKALPTEQSIAEILEGIEPKHLARITLHSHFHLVLAYGVGGIHYSIEHKKTLQEDFSEKVKLYQSFGIKVSTEINTEYPEWQPTDYAISHNKDLSNADQNIFYISKEIENSTMGSVAIDLDQWLQKNQARDLPSQLQTFILNL